MKESIGWEKHNLYSEIDVKNSMFLQAHVTDNLVVAGSNKDAYT
jgi:hypothetical protein